MERTGSLERYWRSQGTCLKGGVGEDREGCSSLGTQTFNQNSGKGRQLMSKGLPKDMLDQKTPPELEVTDEPSEPIQNPCLGDR